MTLSGTLTTLYDFIPTGFGGVKPYCGFIQATDGNFYGLAGGGANSAGTIFEMSPSGVVTTLHNFTVEDGSSPEGGLLQSTNGTFYGTTYIGGADNDGTLFSLSTGLGPFVTTLPGAAKIGATIKVLGTDLVGASSIAFNGVAASFTALSASEIITTVPGGATTGNVQVTTPEGTLLSNGDFRVMP